MAKRKKSMKSARKSAPRKAAKKTARKIQAVPAGYHSLTPYLVVKSAARAIDFYKKAFDAKERTRMAAPDGSVMHAELKIGDSIFMMGEEMPARNVVSAETLGNSPGGLFIYTANVDKAFAKAVAAGARAVAPPTDMFWGDRYAKLIDPFGHQWSMATHIEDVPPKEMQKRGQAEFAKMAAAGGPPSA